MEIVRLTDGDEARLRTIRLRSLRDAPEAFGSTYEETLARPEESWAEQLRDLATYVAVAEGEDVGIVRGCPDDEDPARVWLISMWVAPQARAAGVGDALVRSLTAWASTTGATTLVLEVGGFNDKARGLYERMGFALTGVRRRLAPPRDHIEELEMTLSLSSSPAPPQP